MDTLPGHKQPQNASGKKCEYIIRSFRGGGTMKDKEAIKKEIEQDEKEKERIRINKDKKEISQLIIKRVPLLKLHSNYNQSGLV